MARVFLHLMKSKKTAGVCCVKVLADLGIRWCLLWLQQRFAPGMIGPRNGATALPLGSSYLLPFLLRSLDMRYGSTWCPRPMACPQLGSFQRSRRRDEIPASIADRQT